MSASFRKMDLRQKAEYIFLYYKLPILLGLIALAVLCSVLHRELTKKEPVLYAALVNVSVGDALEQELTEGFLQWSGEEPKKKEVYLYRALYLSDDAAPANHEYAYASRLKLLGAVHAKRLDLALMNREGYDILSRGGYLLDLSAWPEDPLHGRLAPYLTENEVVLEDNAIEYNLNEAAEYRESVKTVSNAVEVSALPLFREAGFSDPVYLGVIANSPRRDAAAHYLAYQLDHP